MGKKEEILRNKSWYNEKKIINMENKRRKEKRERKKKKKKAI
jgi:hypothetical protein